MNRLSNIFLIVTGIILLVWVGKNLFHYLNIIFGNLDFNQICFTGMFISLFLFILSKIFNK